MQQALLKLVTLIHLSSRRSVKRKPACSLYKLGGRHGIKFQRSESQKLHNWDLNSSLWVPGCGFGLYTSLLQSLMFWLTCPSCPRNTLWGQWWNLGSHTWGSQPLHHTSAHRAHLMPGEVSALRKASGPLVVAWQFSSVCELLFCQTSWAVSGLCFFVSSSFSHSLSPPVSPLPLDGRERRMGRGREICDLVSLFLFLLLSTTTNKLQPSPPSGAVAFIHLKNSRMSHNHRNYLQLAKPHLL